ncbi:dipeptidase [Secundilactobacillus pentosiphilus]|uniref:Dipeptidase n=1 Tax=Secundilactobacillus pentosiphilus TaxID=1714682 RepID=A0A1Z5IM52_9LACO|nr:C69 family dipeptidase [Secundilactobacillus pentosiphilus]GAX02776.1 dipeptidase [Secundilactobacillus pentosiphilus]
MSVTPYSACTSILIGKSASVDGSVMIGRNEDSRPAWPKHFVVHPATTNGQTSFESTDNGFKMPLPKTAYKYTATPEWTAKYGLFEEDGINQYGVAMSATESTYANDRVLAADPLVKDGIGEEAMVTVTLPYVKTAREGVSRLGTIISHYGTSESNGILFADRTEAWYFETGSGHYWVAQRIPDDSYAVVANQMAIQTIDFDDPANFMWHPHIQEFVQQHSLNPQRTGFNFREIFGTNNQMDAYYNLPRVWYGQKMFNPSTQQATNSHVMPFIRQAEKLLSVEDAKAFLSSHFQETAYDPIGSGDPVDRKRFRPVSLATTQESHVLQLRQYSQPELSGIHWLAMGVAAQSVYVPFYAGITDTPADYRRGLETYSPDSAYWVFKQAGVLVDPHYKQFGDQLKQTQKELNQLFARSVLQTDQQAKRLAGIELSTLLTQESTKNAELALKKYRELSAKLITQATAFSPLRYHQDMNL